MLVEADTKYLEWLAAVYLSGDKVGYNEIINSFDMHADNQTRLRLPDRLTSKKFLFRLIFGGNEFAYAHDPEFNHISKNIKYWKGVIETFYGKYRGLHNWHGELIREVNRNSGKLVIPQTGRTYEYHKTKGEWPRTTILNYPVQGFGADLMSIARVSLYRRLKREYNPSIKLVSTIHDSILIDAPEKELESLCDLIYQVWNDIPGNFERVFRSKFDLPVKCEIKVGQDWGNMKVIN